LSSNGTGNQIGFVYSPELADDTWQLVMYHWDRTTNQLAQVYKDTTGGASPGAYSSNDWNGPASATIRIGADAVGTTYSGAHKIAHFSIWKKALDSTERSALASGDNPTTVAASDLLLYLYDDHDDTFIGSVNFDQVGAGSAITWDSGDDPTVDAPAVASGIPKTSRIAMLGIG
jgi:hypothetical protein